MPPPQRFVNRPDNLLVGGEQPKFFGLLEVD
jgi:hypothetical protein